MHELSARRKVWGSSIRKRNKFPQRSFLGLGVTLPMTGTYGRTFALILPYRSIRFFLTRLGLPLTTHSPGHATAGFRLFTVKFSDQGGGTLWFVWSHAFLGDGMRPSAESRRTSRPSWLLLRLTDQDFATTNRTTAFLVTRCPRSTYGAQANITGGRRSVHCPEPYIAAVGVVPKEIGLSIAVKGRPR